MLRYYMTPETRQALIAESNRQIAARAAAHSPRARAPARHDDSFDSEWPSSGADTESPPSSVESTFARLVCDLQSVTAPRAPS